MFRRGPGLVRVAATTAVVAGTAGAVSHRQQQRYAGQANEQAQQQQMADMQAQQDALAQQQQMLAQQQAMMAQPAPAAAAPAPSAGSDMMAQLNQLAQLHAAGVLSDAEFAAAKQKLLAS